MYIETIPTLPSTPIPQSRTATNQWQDFSWRQLELDFDLPMMRMLRKVTPADLILDQIYLLADSRPDDADMCHIVEMCREYFYEQDGL